MYRSRGNYGEPRRSAPARLGTVLVVVLVLIGLLLGGTSLARTLFHRAPSGHPGSAIGRTTPSATSPASTAEPTTIPAGDRAVGRGTPRPRGGSEGTVARAPDGSPTVVAQRFLSLWQRGRYDAMYALLSSGARRKYSRGYFVQRYRDIAEMATITGVEPGVSGAPSGSPGATSVKVPYRVIFSTQLVGDIREQNSLPLVAEDGSWRVGWSPRLIFKELGPGEHIYMERYPAPRGTIYDRRGVPLAMDGEIPQVGVIPGQIRNETAVLARLSRALGYSESYIRGLYKGKPDDWFVPIESLSPQEFGRLRVQLADVPGVTFQSRPGRIYPQGTVLAQVLGYVGPITAEDLKRPEYKGYSPNATVGRSGLEHWAERYLRGRDGGRLEVLSADYKRVERVIKSRPAVPGDDIYLNIALDLQMTAERELGKRVGAVVALDPRNGQILAMASHPSYDPNDFVRGMSRAEYARLTSPASHYPLIERATNAAYPMASTFKVITMAAGLTSGLYKPTSMFYDPGHWNGDGGPMRTDWLPGDEGHGALDLSKGLTVSCDVVFYTVGLKLYQYRYDYLPEYARKWGLGESPDVDGLVNEAGQVPGPGVPNRDWNPGDNVNLAIGQGALMVSPLQDAMVYMAIANGGTLYRPELINRIVTRGGGKVVKQYRPEVIRRVPVSPENLRAIQDALVNVTRSYYGTAYPIFNGLPFTVAGKTGTGQQDERQPYAWFSSYAPAGKPRIAMVVMAEDAGEGSEVAAPITRRILADYFNASKAGGSR